MAHGSRLMVHATRLVAQGSWLMIEKNLALGLPSPGPRANFFSMRLEPRAMRHEPWAMNHQPLIIDYFSMLTLQNFQILNFPKFTVSQCQFQTFEVVKTQEKTERVFPTCSMLAILRFPKTNCFNNDVGFCLKYFDLENKKSRIMDLWGLGHCPKSYKAK